MEDYVVCGKHVWWFSGESEVACRVSSGDGGEEEDEVEGERGRMSEESLWEGGNIEGKEKFMEKLRKCK